MQNLPVIHLPSESMPYVVILGNVPTLSQGVKEDYSQLKNKILHWLSCNTDLGTRVEENINKVQRVNWVGR